MDCIFDLNNDGLWQCQNDDCKWVYPIKSVKPPIRNCRPETPEEKAQRKWLEKHGVGFHLHELIEHCTGETISADCNCKSRIAKLNRNGPRWCREHIDEIIDGLLAEIDRRLSEAETRPSWALRIGGLDVPGRRRALTWLVLMAIRRAEKDLRARDPDSPESSSNK